MKGNLDCKINPCQIENIPSVNIQSVSYKYHTLTDSQENNRPLSCHHHNHLLRRLLSAQASIANNTTRLPSCTAEQFFRS